MALTNSETQLQLRKRRQAAYKLLKTLALESGTMQHWKDSDGYDEFIGLLNSGELVLRLEAQGEKDSMRQALEETKHTLSQVDGWQDWIKETIDPVLFDAQGEFERVMTVIRKGLAELGIDTSDPN